jgi:hypothetical protein
MRHRGARAALPLPARLCDDAQVDDLRPKRSGEEPAHDILAAEAFAVPAADPSLRHHLVLPEDPAGRPEPHDILAAEEFAMPAPGPGAGTAHGMGRGTVTRTRLTGLAGVGLGVLWLRRRRR